MKKGKASFEDISNISDNLSKLYKDGINIIMAMELLLEIPLKKTYKNSIRQITIDLKDGKSLASAFGSFKELYPEFFIGMLGLGEETGLIAEVLDGLSKYYKSKYEYKKNILLSGIYPICIFIFFLFFIGLFVYVVIPSFKEVLGEAPDLPTITKKILDVSIYLNENRAMGIIFIFNWLVVIPGMIIKFKRKNLEAYLHKKVRFFKDKTEYEVLMVINLFIASGISISKGIEFYIKQEKVENKEILKNFNYYLLKGETVEIALSKSFEISKYSKAMIKLGEESGSLENRMKRIVEELFKKNEERVKSIVGLVQPIFIGIITLFIILFLVGFFMPIIKNIYGGV